MKKDIWSTSSPRPCFSFPPPRVPSWPGAYLCRVPFDTCFFSLCSCFSTLYPILFASKIPIPPTGLAPFLFRLHSFPECRRERGAGKL